MHKLSFISSIIFSLSIPNYMMCNFLLIHVYQALDIDVEAIKAPSKKISPPTLLLYLFQSEKEVIAEHSLALPSDILQLHPHDKIVDRLGDNAGFMLATYLEVSRVMNEEITCAISGASPTSRMGQLYKWNGELQTELFRKVSQIHHEIGSHITDYSDPEVGRCVCSAVKILRFG